MNPITITKFDHDGEPLETIVARQSNTATFPNSSLITRTDYSRWTRHVYDDQGRHTKDHVYFAIPPTDTGTNTANFMETTYAYDGMGRRNKVTSPGGTITKTEFDARGLPLKTWVGTSETVSSPGELKVVIQNEYDASSNLKKVIQPVDDTTDNDRVMEFGYDFRNRQITVTGQEKLFVQRTFDNLDRVKDEEQRDTNASGAIQARRHILYDTRGQVYRTVVDDVSATPSTKTLVDNTWYDIAGNVIKSAPSGSQAFTKTTYDSLGRATDQHVGVYSGTGTDNPTSLTDNTLVEQTHTTFDDARQCHPRDVEAAEPRRIWNRRLKYAGHRTQSTRLLPGILLRWGWPQSRGRKLRYRPG